MHYFKILGVTLVLLATFNARAQTPPETTSTSSTKAQALEQLWSLSEKISPVTENSINGYKKFAEQDADRFLLDDPHAKVFVADALKRRWLHSMDANFSESEINFLIKLYTSKTYQKLGEVENKIWARAETSDLIRLSLQQAVKKFNLKPVSK